VSVTAAVPGAIVFTDIVGFTELTDAHGDDLALEVLERQEQLVQGALAPSGRVVKELGDGLLLWFGAAADAVATCVELQHRFERESCGGVPLWVRIGVHWGHPRHRGDDIIGRDVNLAARIADLAGAGEILCSHDVVLAAGHVPGVHFEPVGLVYLRGISAPVSLARALASPE